MQRAQNAADRKNAAAEAGAGMHTRQHSVAAKPEKAMPSPDRAMGKAKPSSDMQCLLTRMRALLTPIQAPHDSTVIACQAATLVTAWQSKQLRWTSGVAGGQQL